jgi:hypothetical protein
MLSGMAREEGGFFSLWRRELPKRQLRDAELSAWVCRVLVRAIAANATVSIRYRPESAQTAEAFSLVPTELYGRGPYVYVDGRIFPYGETRTLSVDRIFDARIERPAAPAGRRESREAGGVNAGLAGLEPGSAAEPAPTGRRVLLGGLSIGISLLLALGGAFGGLDTLRRYLGW